MIKVIANVNATIADEHTKGIYIFDLEEKRRNPLTYMPTHLLTEINGERTTPLYSKIFSSGNQSLLTFMTKDRLLCCDFNEIAEKKGTFEFNELKIKENCSLENVVKKLELSIDDPLSKIVESKEKNLGGSIEILNGNLYWQIHRNLLLGNEGIKMIAFNNFFSEKSLLNLSLLDFNSSEFNPTMEIKSLNDELLLACHNSFHYGNNGFQTESGISTFDTYDNLIAIADFSSNYYLLHNNERIAKGDLDEYAQSVAIGKYGGEYNIIYGHSDGFITLQKFNPETNQSSMKKINLYQSLYQSIKKMNPDNLDNNNDSDDKGDSDLDLLEKIESEQRKIKHLKITPDGKVFFSIKRFIPYFRLEDANDNIIELRDYFLTAHRTQHFDIHYKVQ